MNPDLLGMLLLLFIVVVVALAFFLPKVKDVLDAKEEETKMNDAMSEIYQLAGNNESLVRKALAATANPETGKSSIEKVKAWLVEHNETEVTA